MGLFLPINSRLKGEPLIVGLRKISKVLAALLDLSTMVTLLASCPTFVKELIPNADHFYGYCNTCTTGTGGVWFSGKHNLQPIVWQVELEHPIERQVVSNNNPRRGRIPGGPLVYVAVTFF
jgi:hypothetical protein